MKYKSKVAGRSIRIQLSLQERERDCVSIDDNYRGKLGGAGRMQIRPAEIRVALSWKESRACCASVHRSAQSNQKTFVIDEELAISRGTPRNIQVHNVYPAFEKDLQI